MVKKLLKKATSNPLAMGVIAVVVIGLIAALVFPGWIESIGNAIFGEVSSCEDTPYDVDCFCEAGIERKISVPWIGVPRWSCETLGELLIDPESPTFEADAIAFSEEYLSRWCSTIATDFTCGTGVCVTGTGPIYPINKCLTAGFGYNIEGARSANIECVEQKTWQTPQGELTHEEALAIYGNQPNADIWPSSGSLPWRMFFFVESETGTPKTMFPESNYYYNADTKQKCTHSSYCDYVYAQVPQDPFTIENPDWCVGDLPLDVIPFTPDSAFSIFGGNKKAIPIQSS